MIIKELKEKTEIVNAINFNKYPVVNIDAAKDAIEMNGKIVGFSTPVRVPWNYNGETLYLNANLTWFEYDQLVEVSSYGCTLSSGFGYSDMQEMLKYSNAPIIDKDTTFVLVVHNSKTRKTLCPLLISTDSHKNINCQTVLKTNAKINFLSIV